MANVAEITRRDIVNLSSEAANAGDTGQVAICEAALAGDAAAVAECERVINNARAMVEVQS